MDNDFKPAKRPAKSLRKALDSRLVETPTESSKDFRTPEEAAAADDVEEVVELPDNPSDDTKPKNKAGQGGRWQSLKQKLALHWPPGRKEYIVAGVVILLLAAGITQFLLANSKFPLAPLAGVKKAAPPKSTTVASKLTGLQVDPTINNRPVTALMIENSVSARPQSGLTDAGVVFEAIAEGGITRFLALYQDTTPGEVGPVRSARPYYLHWTMGFDANYGHVGGSPDALAAIKSLGVRDLDQFANAGAYRRASHRSAPHNVYTSVETLMQLGISKGYATSNYNGFVRKKPAKSKTKAPTPTPPAAMGINFAVSGPTYNVHYDYVASSKTYNRTVGGAAHMDANGNRQLNPTVVIAMVIPYSQNGKYAVYQTIGSGPVFIFQGGNVNTGTWTKSNEKAQITFTDPNGNTIELDPGQTWLTAVSDSGRVTYNP